MAHTAKIALRIVLVDDTPHLLETQQNLMKRISPESTFSAFSNVEDAIDHISLYRTDMVITDMDMPFLNGTHLLDYIADNHPSIIRVVLSACTDTREILKTVHTAHQYLQKPINKEQISELLINADGVLSFLKRVSTHNLNTKSSILGLKGLPVLPSVYQELFQILRSPFCSVQQIAKSISKDVALTANILKLVNSSYFGIPNHIATPEQAVAMLGIDIVKSVVLSLSIFEEAAHCSRLNNFIDDLYRHSLNVATIAKAIAKEESANKDLRDAVFIASLLHEIGKVLIIINNVGDFKRKKSYKEINTTLEQIENEMFEGSHEILGASLLGLWGLTAEIIWSIAYHRTPSLNSCQNRILPYIHFSKQFCSTKERNICNPIDLDREFLKRYGLNEHCENWKIIAEREFSAITD